MTRATAQVGLILLVALALFISLPALVRPAQAADNAKWFVCKYEGTPGIDERLQTGDNPISVSENAIGISPVVAGTFFQDAQGRSYVLVEDTGQPEPDPSLCPPPDTGGSPTPTPTASPTPTPSATASATPTASPTGSPTPSPTVSPPTPTLFSIEVCPETGEPVATGRSLIRFEHPFLILLLLNVRIDGELVTLRSVIGNQLGAQGVTGTAAEVEVSVGVHDWSISNPGDTEVLASGTVNCPECNPATVTVPPGAPTPPPDLPDTSIGSSAGSAWLWAGLLLVSLLTLAGLNLVSARRRSPPPTA